MSQSSSSQSSSPTPKGLPGPATSPSVFAKAPGALQPPPPAVTTGSSSRNVQQHSPLSPARVFDESADNGRNRHAAPPTSSSVAAASRPRAVSHPVTDWAEWGRSLLTNLFQGDAVSLEPTAIELQQVGRDELYDNNEDAGDGGGAGGAGDESATSSRRDVSSESIAAEKEAYEALHAAIKKLYQEQPLSMLQLLAASTVIKNLQERHAEYVLATCERSDPAKMVTSVSRAAYLVRMFNFCLGTYGWKYATYSNAHGINTSLQLVSSSPLEGNMATLFAFTKIPPQDVLMHQWNSAVYRPAYYLVVDRVTESVVLAIRGSMSLADAMTDIVSEVEPFEPPRAPGGSSGPAAASPSSFSSPSSSSSSPSPSSSSFSSSGGAATHYAHRGMLKAARWFVEEGVVAAMQLAVEREGFRPVVTGHSLGAGVAVLVGILARDRLPEVRVIGYGTPCAISASLATSPWAMGHITTVIHGHDIVARLSLSSVERFTKVAERLCAEGNIYARLFIGGSGGGGGGSGGGGGDAEAESTEQLSASRPGSAESDEAPTVDDDDDDDDSGGSSGSGPSKLLLDRRGRRAAADDSGKTRAPLKEVVDDAKTKTPEVPIDPLDPGAPTPETLLTAGQLLQITRKEVPGSRTIANMFRAKQCAEMHRAEHAHYNCIRLDGSPIYDHFPESYEQGLKLLLETLRARDASK
jgi:hypothetical protein